jgi:predicted ATPase
MHLSSVRFHPEKYPTNSHYPFNLDIFLSTDVIQFTSPVTFFIGENGSGKSTLLEALSKKCGIHIWQDASRTPFKSNPHEKNLFKAIEVEWTNGYVHGSFFDSELFKDFTRILDEWAKSDEDIFDYFGGDSLVSKSHGESIISYCEARYRIKGLYLLDEPETALSPASQMEMLKIITRMSRQGHAQFIIATHSPILMACPEARILSFDTSPISDIKYEDTEYYRFYKDFMNDTGKYTNDI